MTPRETVDEAIDRVASQLTAVDARVARRIAPVWRERQTPSRLGWYLVAASAAAIVAALFVATWNAGERPGDISPLESVAAGSLSPYSAVPDTVRPVAARVAIARAPVTRVADAPRDTREDETWGIPSIAVPAALTVDVVSVTSIDTPDVGVVALTMAPLAIEPIGPPRR